MHSHSGFSHEQCCPLEDLGKTRARIQERAPNHFHSGQYWQVSELGGALWALQVSILGICRFAVAILPGTSVSLRGNRYFCFFNPEPPYWFMGPNKKVGGSTKTWPLIWSKYLALGFCQSVGQYMFIRE